MPFVAPPTLTRQGARYSTFTPPPLDGSCTLAQAYDWHLAHSPEHPLYTYEDLDDGTIQVVKWKDAVTAVYRAANFVQFYAADKPSFAVLAVSDSITFGSLTVGIMRAGYTPFIPSPRVSAEVLAQLLDKAGTTHVFYSADAATTKLAHAGTAHRSIKLLPLPQFSDLFNSDPAPAPEPVSPDIYDHGMIIHSSGSTSLPKLLPVSHSTLVLLATAPWTHDVDMGSSVMNYSVTPMYHLMGFAQVLYAAYCGLLAAVFPPVFPPVMPRTESFLRSVVATKSTMTIIMPSMLESISLHPEQTKILAGMDAVVFGGASLKQHAGDRLVDAGVPLVGGFGMSECGVISAFLHKPFGRDWQYMRLARFTKVHYRDLGDGTYELIILSHDGQRIDTTNCEVDGYRACATKDVVVFHPSNPRMFKIIGRLDDQIVLSTGEKTNAIPLEGILRSNPLIEYAVVFGRGRPHNGVIIMPPAEHAFDPSDKERLHEYRDAIWPSVVHMNTFAPSHSRIGKEMILVAHPSKPFAINQIKNTVVRALVTAAYEQEISEAYEEFDRAIGQDVPVPTTWEYRDVLTFVRHLVQKNIPDISKDNDDLFNYGCDSLVAARIHNGIVRALQSSGVDATKLPADMPYKFPTITSLTGFATATANSSTFKETMEDPDTPAIEAMLAKYTQSFPEHVSSSSQITTGKHHGSAVLVTGTTGGLGTHMLAQLLERKDVWRVYALNRRSPANHLLDRHKAIFADRGLDPDLLDLGKLVILEGDTTRDDLALRPMLYDELRNNVTHIIHNAWPVNFNYALATFEPAVKGARNLIDLALKSARPSPPKFQFISSVSVSQYAAPSPDVSTPEEPILDAKLVAGMGYAESKWIVERMLQLSPLQALSVRVGQLAGGKNGCWNVNDWVPVIVRSAPALGCLPDSSSTASWMRLDEAAAALIDMLSFTESGVLHLVHPRPIPWRDVFQTYASTLNVPLVPFPDWLNRLTKHAADPAGVPAVRLLEFWKTFGDAGFDAMSGIEAVDTTRAQAVSPTLRDMRPLDQKDVRRWYEYWTRTGALRGEPAT
ncbi:acetyl-CoA synthetase-like protein [Auricularia subglabra TFB-10046 SS5]|nr:acetyl-CoA synthetase-like protein [Auricularia subglabra TFB-10046 SS5]